MQGVELRMSERGARKLEKPKVSLQGFFQADLGVRLSLSVCCSGSVSLLKDGHSTQKFRKECAYSKYNQFTTG